MKIYFWTVLSFLIAILFVFNAQHINQQGTYENIFVPIAESLINGNGYTCAALNNEILFYPMWAYTFLVAINLLIGYADLVIYTIQFLLCFSAISVFYKLFALQYKYWHIPLFLPFIALMSVKWPDAIVGALIIFYTFYFYSYLISANRKHLIISGIILGIVLNFRSEYLYLPIIQMLFIVLPRLKGFRIKYLISNIIIFVVSLIFLLPWAIRSYVHTDEFRFSASNGAAVMYISLGQLSDNPWNIVPIDKTAYDFAKAKGHSNPYSPSSDSLFKEEVKERIKEYPLAFAKKSASNFASAWFNGVYTGEYANFFISKQRRNIIGKQIIKENGVINKFSLLTNLKSSESIPLIIEKAIRGIFIPIILILFVALLIYIWKEKNPRFVILLVIIGGIIVYKFIIISTIQYEYRHINAIYLLLLGCGMLFFQSLRRK